MGLRALALVLAAGLLGACAEELPPAAADGTAPAFLNEGTGESDVGPCTPDTPRECRSVFVDEYGVTHCPKSWQFCNPEGTGYYACGDYDTADDGSPRPPARPREH